MATKQAKRAAPTRERILSAARHLFQQRGYYGVGTAEILAAAHAPKGSMYHHFPDGKEQIALAAVAAIREDLRRHLAALIAEDLTTADIVRRLARGMAAWLKSSQWREGTMLTSTVIGSVPELPQLHRAIRETFAEWHGSLVERLIADGHKRAKALTLAYTLIAGLEGAMILARVEQDERVLLKVAEELADLTQLQG